MAITRSAKLTAVDAVQTAPALLAPIGVFLLLRDPREAFLCALQPWGDLKRLAEIVERLVELAERFIGLAPPAQGNCTLVVAGQCPGQIVDCLLVFPRAR
jgi:hypothetical protein